MTGGAALVLLGEVALDVWDKVLDAGGYGAGDGTGHWWVRTQRGQLVISVWPPSTRKDGLLPLIVPGLQLATR